MKTFLGYTKFRASGATAVAAMLLAVNLGGCVSSSATADSVVREEGLRRQQAEQKVSAPDDRGLYLTLIREMQTRELYYASLAHIDAFEQKYGEKSDIELLRGDALRETEQGDAALVVYRKIANAGNDGANNGNSVAQALHGIGLINAQKARYAEAIDALTTASSLDPTNVSFLNDLGYANLLSGNLSGARLPIAQAAELAPANRKVLANLVLYLLLSGDQAGADDVIARAKLPDTTVKATRALAARLSDASAKLSPVASAGPKLSLPEAQSAKTLAFAPGENRSTSASTISLTTVPTVKPGATLAAASTTPTAAAPLTLTAAPMPMPQPEAVVATTPLAVAPRSMPTGERVANNQPATATTTTSWQLHSMMERFGATQ